MMHLLRSVRCGLCGSGKARLDGVSTVGVEVRALCTSPVLEVKRQRKLGPGWGPSFTPYLSLYNIIDDGKRRTFRAAVERFKRLDWGMYIRPKAGRDKKHWKKTAEQLWRNEQHVFCAPFHVRRLERMFGPELKMPRFIPDDPYQKYNETSYHKHWGIKRKNMENIRLYGNNIYRFNPWKAFLSKHMTRYNRPEKVRYEPPGYVANVSANNEVYQPEFVPEDIPAPHFQRPPVKNNKHLHDYQMKHVKNFEIYYGHLDPWHPLNKSMFRKF